MSYNYAEQFEREIMQQYARELTSASLADNRRVRFIDAQTIKVPTVTMSGYKDHVRDGSKNRGTIANTWQSFTLAHDRNIEFYVDEMDVDETHQALSAANITGEFNATQAIPELDAYRYSKLYTEFLAQGGTAVTTALTTANILSEFDKIMEAMDEAAVPESGRVLRVTPTVYTMLKNAENIDRSIDVSAARSINRHVRGLDEVTIVKVPSDRMKTAYEFTEGWKPGSTAKQIHMILTHSSAIIAPVKVADVYLWPKGNTPESAYGWLYQNRSYHDLFVFKPKVAGIAMVVSA